MPDRWTSIAVAAVLALLPQAAGAGAPDRHDAVIVIVEGEDRAWYDQPPLAGTGPGHYYSQHPDHVPSYPHALTGYPVPIYGLGRSPGLVVHGAWRRPYSSAHVSWCMAHYRSYRVGSDSFQPYQGPRRRCRSPFR